MTSRKIVFILLLFLFSNFSCNNKIQPLNTETKHSFTNQLIHETSPYLLQHAYNPVNWYPWKEEALQKAKNEDRPILVSIGYAACHWCHVMEHESFEDTAVAKIMNENFICIKIDREERPDIDQIYMDAVQAITGSGGWPLNVFLTPDQKPFYGGTYFPPDNRFNRPSWTQVLQNISKTFREKRKEVEEQAERLTAHLKNADSMMVEKKIFENLEVKKVFTKKSLENIFNNLKERFDTHDGGFGAAPKFPSTMSIQFLLRHYYFTKNKEAIEQAELSLEKMICGGIYDHVGGGFSRYSTDKKWLVPHFEKMLYDNALLVETISEAYQLTKKEIYKETIIETLHFIQREMTSDEGGFYSSYDADSEGEEGKYFVWSKKEIDSLLGANSKLFCEYYGVSDKGNWEGKNILNLRTAKLYDSANKDKELLKQCREILFKAREKRVKPGLDDKIILGWNAMMCSAFAKAYQAIPDEEWKETAERNINFILKNLRTGENNFAFFHTYKNGKKQYPAFLDDYASLVNALLDVYEINQNEQLLHTADSITKFVIEDFYDETDGMFFYTSEKQKDILMRKKDFYDNAIPSGISIMAKNLQRLAVIFDNSGYSKKSIMMIQNILLNIEKYPNSFSQWANVLVNYVYPVKEIAVVGDDYKSMAKKINELFLPNRVLMSIDGKTNSSFPLLKDKTAKDRTLIYVCENFTCKKPVSGMEEAKKLLTEYE